MRIPFDLIAAILCADRIGEYLNRDDAVPAHFRDVAWVWLAFWFGSWLAHEIAARLAERRTDFGRNPDGGATGLHPQQFYARLTWAAQAFSVALYAGATWYLNWPLTIASWPRWFGLDPDFALGSFVLAKSVVATSLLIIGPYLIAMVLSWIPRRRIASGTRRRLIPLFAFLSFEAKLTWLPFCVSIVFAILSDIGQVLPRAYTSWLENEPAQSLFLVGVLALTAVIVMPLAAVKMWECEPLPSGELKERLERLLARSGIKTRPILMWGGRSTGMLNACIVGLWSPFRYVLISPALAETLSVDEAEAVLGHELGHARYGHPILQLSVYLCIVMSIGVLYNRVANGWQSLPLLQVAFTMTILIGFIYFFFGAVSRQCERKADLASAELIGTPQPLIAALEKVGACSGNSRRVPCWHHGSIADRIAAVARLSNDPGESLRFHARLKMLRIGVLILAALFIAAQLFFHG